LQSRLPQRVLSHQIQRRNYTKLEQEQSELAAGSGCSSAGSISSAGGKYSGYSSPGM
nr:hypothetical protein [Tanacetum cinerariifolium]